MKQRRLLENSESFVLASLLNIIPRNLRQVLLLQNEHSGPSKTLCIDILKIMAIKKCKRTPICCYPKFDNKFHCWHQTNKVRSFGFMSIIYRQLLRQFKQPKYKKGDNVRMSKIDFPFQKD